MDESGPKFVRCDEGVIGCGSSFLQRTSLRACWCGCSVNGFFKGVRYSPSGDHGRIFDGRASIIEEDGYTVVDGMCVFCSPRCPSNNGGHCHQLHTLLRHLGQDVA